MAGACVGALRPAWACAHPKQEIGLTAHVVQASDSIPDHGLDAMDTAWSGGRTCTETKHASVLDGARVRSAIVCTWQHGHHDRTRHTTPARSARVMLGTIPAALLGAEIVLHDGSAFFRAVFCIGTLIWDPKEAYLLYR